MSYNKVIMVGRLSKDIDLRYSPAGTAIAKSTIASSHKFKDRATEEIKEEVCFIDFTLFGRSAEVANQYLRKGSKVLIEGRLVLNQWVASDGTKKSKHEIVVERMQMLDSKKTEEENGYGNQNPAPQTQSRPQPQSNPDIDEDEIPF
jgi:single-strand DNA-binding protein